MAGRVAGEVPHTDEADQDALNCVSLELAHDGGWGSGSSQFVKEVQLLLCFLSVF